MTSQMLCIGLDLGTSNAKAVALTADRRVVAIASSGYAMHSPHPGRAEQNPDDVWYSAAEALRSLVAQLNPVEVAGLCLSGAMHSSLPVSIDGTPLAPAMTWADQRATAIAKKLREETDAHALYLRTGCPLQSIYHVAKLRWWVENGPESVRKATRFVTIKDYTLFQLTGEWVSDLGLASTTGLLDIRRYTWDDEALSLAAIAASQLPHLVSTFTIVGRITDHASRITSLPADLPIVVGSSDGGLANLGAGASRPGQSIITVGTSGAVRRIVEEPYLDQHERTWCYILTEGNWFAGGAINNGGLAVQWVREKFYPDLPGEAGYRQLFADAAEVPPGAEGVMVLPYFAGERSPYWNADARATIIGLGLEHDRRHIARAVLEGVAFCLSDVWDALDTPTASEPIRLTGVVTQSSLWAQIVCDVLGVPLAAVETADASAVGAAMVGHMALGNVPSLEHFTAPECDRTHPDRTWLPNPEQHDLYRRLQERFRELCQKIY